MKRKYKQEGGLSAQTAPLLLFLSPNLLCKNLRKNSHNTRASVMAGTVCFKLMFAMQNLGDLGANGAGVKISSQK